MGALDKATQDALDRKARERAWQAEQRRIRERQQTERQFGGR